MPKRLKSTEEIRRLSDEELARELEESYQRLLTLRLQKETRQLTNHRELVKVRRHIARLKTVQRERELARARSGQP
jgi:large subunit ribosomal protein L29